jgi:hypothetical protein
MGMITYTTQGGATIGKQKVFNPANPKTMLQMYRRTCWANIVNIWQTMLGNDKPSFENKGARVSDYNKFIGVNVGGPRVYLTKSEATQGGSVVAAYRMTEGSLPAIDVLQSAGQFVTNVSVGETAVSNSTTVGTLADAIVENNDDWRYGDKISAFVFEQSVDSVTGVPHVVCRSYKITLISEDERTLGTVLGGNLEAFTVTGGKLGMQGPINGGVVWVHSRIDSSIGKTLVSTQYINVTNNILSSYTSASKRESAIISYGGKPNRAFLTPDIQADITL